jgi:hypothetical protein
MNRQEWLTILKKRFDFDSWPCSEKSKRFRTQGFNLNIKHMAETWNLEKRVPFGSNEYVDYFESEENDKHRIMVRVSECHSHDDACLVLLEVLGSWSAITFPRLNNLEIEIGDVGFKGHGDMPTSIIFVRYNVLADIRSIGDEPISVLEFSQVVDNNIKNAASL